MEGMGYPKYAVLPHVKLSGEARVRLDSGKAGSRPWKIDVLRTLPDIIGEEGNAEGHVWEHV